MAGKHDCRSRSADLGPDSPLHPNVRSERVVPDVDAEDIVNHEVPIEQKVRKDSRRQEVHVVRQKGVDNLQHEPLDRRPGAHHTQQK